MYIKKYIFKEKKTRQIITKIVTQPTSPKTKYEIQSKPKKKKNTK